MSIPQRLTEVFEETARLAEVEFDDNARLVFFSDSHRGDNSWADDFAHNQLLFFYALRWYYEHNFTYIEVGDGQELWENKSFEDVRRAHSHIYWLMRQFYLEDRLYLLFGNHDIFLKNPDYVRRYLYHYQDTRTGLTKPLFDGIVIYEGLMLRHRESGGRFFVTHGHQGELLSDTLWPIGRFTVRHFWRHAQLLGLHDPTSPAENYSVKIKIERDIAQWVRDNHQPIICGHTHRPAFPNPGEVPYFNTGSGVHPRCITGIEITEGWIVLVKWWTSPDEDGRLKVRREVLAGPQRVGDYFRD